MFTGWQRNVHDDESLGGPSVVTRIEAFHNLYNLLTFITCQNLVKLMNSYAASWIQCYFDETKQNLSN